MKSIITSLILLTALSASAQVVVKKVVLEDFTGTWCQWCPEGTGVIEALMAANPTNFIPVASHSGDALECPDGAAMVNALGVSSFPAGAVDRFKLVGTGIPQGRGSWSSSVATRLAGGAIVSIAFANVQVSGNTYSGDIKVKFMTAPAAGKPIKVNVLALEDSIAAVGQYEQTNAVGGNPFSTYQTGNNPLVNFFHNDVLRDAVNTVWGYANVNIPAVPVVGTEYTESFVFIKQPIWKQKNMKFVAYVAYDGTVGANEKEILNADKFSLRYLYPNGVNEVSNNTLQANVYPNPAKTYSFITTSFTLQHDANVTFEVLNSVGQVISKPYTSFEIAGAHSIQWNPREYASNITPGLYTIKLTTDKGDTQLSKLVIE
jgi:thiol-disulfide isomerase/thioredoxin